MKRKESRASFSDCWQGQIKYSDAHHTLMDLSTNLRSLCCPASPSTPRVLPSESTTVSATPGPSPSSRPATSTVVVQIPIVKDRLAFEARQARCLKALERLLRNERRRRVQSWERDMAAIKSEFLTLHPVNESNSSLEDTNHEISTAANSANDPLVTPRCESTEVLDRDQMKTLFLEFPDEMDRPKFRIRFDVGEFDRGSVSVVINGQKITVRAMKLSELQKNIERKSSKSDPNSKPCSLAEVVNRSKTIRVVESAVSKNGETAVSESGVNPSAELAVCNVLDAETSHASVANNGEALKNNNETFTAKAGGENTKIKKDPTSEKNPREILTANASEAIQLETYNGTTSERASSAISEQNSNQTAETRELSKQEINYLRSIEIPAEADEAHLISYLTADGILILEAPLLSPTALAVKLSRLEQIAADLAAAEAAAGLSQLDFGSEECLDAPGGTAGESVKEKVGVPLFREENGHRRLHLVVDLGAGRFEAADVHVEMMKFDRILVRAKRKDHSVERSSIHKFYKEYELVERIDRYSLRGNLQKDGRLVVGAYAKGHAAKAREEAVAWDEARLKEDVARKQEAKRERDERKREREERKREREKARREDDTVSPSSWKTADETDAKSNVRVETEL